MGFIKTAIRRPVTIFMLILCVLLFGVMAIFNMPVALLPDMNMPMLTVVTAYPGASPEDVEEDLTVVLEKELKTLSGLNSIQTYSLDNVSAILLEFEFGSDTSELADAVRSKLELVSLPSGCESPVVQNIDLGAMPIAKVAVSAEDAETLVAEEISPAFESIKGVSSVTTVGAKSRKIEITPKDNVMGVPVPVTLTALLVQAISAGAYDIPLGSITEDGKIVTVRNVSDITSIDELKSLPIEVPFNDATILEALKKLFPDLPINGSNVTLPLSMVADVSEPIDVYEDGKATINGEPCIILSVFKLQDGNTTNIVDALKTKIKDFNETEGLSLTLVDDQSQYISDSISSVWSSLAIGAVLAFLIIVLFLANVKSSLIISLSMPLSVLLALICLFALNISLNLVSLGGLALGIGMLVDNSIVVIESITRRREELGEEPKEAAANGTKSVAGSIFASTLTSVAVFFPIMFVKGMTEEIFRDLSFSVIFSLVFSLIVALSVIPSMYAKFGGRKRKKPVPVLPESSEPEISAEPSASAVVCESPAPAKPRRSPMRRMEEGYGKLLTASLGKRWLVLVLALVFFGASVALLFTTGQEFLPSMERGVVEVTVETPEGSVAATETKLAEVAALIESEIPDVETLTTSIDTGSILNLGTKGSISIKLKDGAKRSEHVANDIREAVSGVENATITARAIDGVVEMLMNGVSGVSISINGKDEAVLKQIQTEIVSRAQEIEGVTSVSGSLGDKQTQLRINLDQSKVLAAASSHGMSQVTYDALVKTLRIGLAGMGADADIAGTKTELNVSFGGIASSEELENLLIFPASGDKPAVTLSELLNDKGIERVEVPTVVKKLNGNLTLEISAEIYGVDSGTVEKKIKDVANEVLANPAYEGYEMESSGVTKYLGEAFSGLVVALVISLFLVFAIMASQFESLKKPFIIMFSIPFSFTGGFLALAITGTTLNVVSFIGVIMLIGVIVNNAIVMIDKIEELRKGGMDHYEAVLAGTESRLRPILMTTLTTVLALVPLALGIGKGSELLQPMGIVVIGGMLLGTLVTLVLIPTVYTLIAKVKIRREEKKNPEKEKED